MQVRMVVRIRFSRGPVVGRKLRGDEGLASLAAALAALLTPAAVMALVLGIWRIAADLKLTSSFYIASGPLSDWRFWFGAAAVLQLCSYFLNRYGKSKDTPAS
jgi:hypothetical protein